MLEGMQQSEMFKFIIVVNSFWTCIQYSIKALMAFNGTNMTNEAENSMVLVIKITATANLDDRASFNYLLTQTRCRNKKLQNDFFVIDWKLILTVSFECL